MFKQTNTKWVPHLKEAKKLDADGVGGLKAWIQKKSSFCNQVQ